MKHIQEVQNRAVSRIDENNAMLEKDYQLRKKAQQTLAVNLSRVSPASALTFGSMALARTGVNEYDRFLASLRTYKPIYTKWINSKMGNTITSMVGGGTQIDISDMPQHSYEPESLRQSMIRAIPDFGLMIGLIIVFFVGAYVSFLHYDVR